MSKLELLKVATMLSCWSEINIRFTEKWVLGGLFSFKVIADRPGHLVFQVKGKDAEEIFKHEPGGHRWQRIPPTERKGRVHTSTITVAVLKELKNLDITLSSKDITYKATRGSGPGGQKRNKVHSAVQVTHKKTGIRVDCCEGVSQKRNKDKALKRMEKRLNKAQKKKARKERDQLRKTQVGSGMRGDKVRTIRCRNDMVTNHKNGKKMSYKKYIEGFIEDLH